jgi:hypothetical protein
MRALETDSCAICSSCSAPNPPSDVAASTGWIGAASRKKETLPFPRSEKWWEATDWGAP